MRPCLPPLLAAAVLVAGLGDAHAERVRRIGFSIVRKDTAALSRTATADEIAALVAGSVWFRGNPKKETSDWEGQTWVFHAGGEVEITTHHIPGPEVTALRWKVARAGARPVIEIGRRKYRLASCSHSDRSTITLCLF